MKRESGTELLRVILMMIIVFGHCCLFLSLPDAKVGKILSVPGVFATDAFVLISGWYGIRVSLQKCARFFGLGVFAYFVITFASYVTGVRGGACFSLGWFGNCYLALMFLSPLISAGIEKLREKNLLGKAWCFYASAMLIAWMPVKGLGISIAPTGWTGLSFNTICFVYVTGRVMRESSFMHKIGWKRWLVVFAVLMALSLFWSRMAMIATGKFERSVFIGSKDYNSPIVLGLAVSFFMMFRFVKLPDRVSKILLFVSPSMFSVYLIHEGCNGTLSRAIYNQYASFEFGVGFGPSALRILVASVLVFTFCLFIDLLRRGVLWSIGNIKK